jgi:hypothetical protein
MRHFEILCDDTNSAGLPEPTGGSMALSMGNDFDQWI